LEGGPSDSENSNAAVTWVCCVLLTSYR